MADPEDVALVRLLLNDTATEASGDRVFTDAEIGQFLALEGERIKAAAAQAYDTIASNEALVAKVIETQRIKTDGAKLADSLRKHATALRAQDQADVDEADDYFEVIDINGPHGSPELTGWY